MELRKYHPGKMESWNDGKLGRTIHAARKGLCGRFIASLFRYSILPLIFILMNTGFHHGPSEIKITKAYVRVATKGMTTAAYLKITNLSALPDTLYGVEADFAGMAQLHESFRKDGIVGMRPVNFLVIPGRSSVEFKPGYYHIMLMDVKKDLKIGKTAKFELRFRRNGKIGVVGTVKE